MNNRAEVVRTSVTLTKEDILAALVIFSFVEPCGPEAALRVGKVIQEVMNKAPWVEAFDQKINSWIRPPC